MSRIVIVLVALAGLLGSATAAQAQPSEPSAGLVTGSVSSNAERAEVVAFVDYYIKQLASRDAAQREAAREKLASQTGKPGVSGAFRNVYTRELFNAGLLDVIKGENVHAAANALRVAATLGDKKALDEVARLLDRRDEPRWYIRLSAASAMTRLMADTASVPARQRLQRVDDIAQAVKTETNPYVVRRLFEAMSAMNDPDARLKIAEALGSAVARLKDLPAEEAAPMLRNLDIVLYRLYDSYLRDIEASEKRDLGAAYGPALGQLYQVALQQWDSAQSGAARDEFGRILERAESFLQRIDGIVRSTANDRPRTEPKQVQDYWQTGNRSQFQTHWGQWQGILKGNPYNMPG